MNDLAKRWIEALRSGKYEQGKYALRTSDNCYCCLGVLADVAKPDGWSNKVTTLARPENFKSGALEVYKHDGMVELISDDLWAEVTGGTDWMKAVDIAAANDDGKTFEEIVTDYILPMFEAAKEEKADA